MRVAPAPALVAGGGLAFAESALDDAELKVPNVALTLAVASGTESRIRSIGCCRDGRPASGTRHPPLVRSDTLGASALSWPLPEAGGGLPGRGVHRGLQPGPSGPCSLPGQRAPEFFPEQNGGRPMTRAMEQSMDAPARVLRLPRVQARTGLARSTIYVRVADGSFPQPIRLGARAVGWIESEVDAWIRERIAASRGNAK